MDTVKNSNLTDLLKNLNSKMAELSAAASGEDRVALLKQQDILASLALAAIANELNTKTVDFQNAISTLQSAINTATAATTKIQKISSVIDDVAKAISAVKSVIS